ncbi:MAG: NAD(P)H-hydrate epimerase [Planctomycetota bacterium]
MKREQVRKVDQIAINEFGIPGVVLMENAGRNAATVIHELYPHAKKVAILCGPGNNGGDGYVIARHLELKGHDIRIASLVQLEKLVGDAAINASVAMASDLRIQVSTDGDVSQTIGDADLIIDCLLGTGATGPPRTAFANAIRLANQAPARRVAIDLPSGLDCDTGEPNEPTFQADATLTFVAEKDGFQSSRASAFTGSIDVIDIGVPAKLLRSFDLLNR